jgi:hypothetical protein
MKTEYGMPTRKASSTSIPFFTDVVPSTSNFINHHLII